MSALHKIEGYYFDGELFNKKLNDFAFEKNIKSKLVNKISKKTLECKKIDGFNNYLKDLKKDKKITKEAKNAIKQIFKKTLYTERE